MRAIMNIQEVVQFFSVVMHSTFSLMFKAERTKVIAIKV